MPGDWGIKRVRTQGEAHTGSMGKPEDAGPAPIIRIHPARGVVESTIWLRSSGPGLRPTTERVMSDQLKVLIADDHPLIIAGIRRTIEHVDDMHVVGEAQPGGELVQLIERRRPDVVLMDLRMPGVTGTEMIALIHKRWPGTKTVVLSACDDAPVIEATLRAGASAYVLNTPGSLDITSILRQAADGEVLPAPVTMPARPAASEEPDV